MGTINPDTPLHDPDYDIAVRDPEAAARGLAIIQQLLDEGEEAQERKEIGRASCRERVFCWG